MLMQNSSVVFWINDQFTRRLVDYKALPYFSVSIHSLVLHMFRGLTRDAAFHLDYLVLQLPSQILCHWPQRNTVTGQSNVCVLFWGLYSPMHAIVVLLTEGTVQIDFQESLVAKYCLLSHFHQTSPLICSFQGSTKKRCNDCPTHELQILLYVSDAWDTEEDN